jgi:hypothetical protein
VLAFVHQVANAWVTQTELRAIADREARTPTMDARRAAITQTVQRLFPAQTGTSRAP